MNRKVAMIATGMLVISLAVVASAIARPGSHKAASTVTASSLCKTAGIAYGGPLSGGAAFLGDDQRNWMRLFISYWNTGKRIPGVPATMKRVKIVDAFDGDGQLDGQKAATVAAQMVGNSKILGVVGFAGTNENLGGMPVLIRGGLAGISGSATGDNLTDGKSLKPGYFFRVVPNNSAQAALGVKYMFTKLSLKKNDKVMVVDDAEAYGIGISDAAQAKLKAGGVTVDRESQDQKNTDYSALAQKAVFFSILRLTVDGDAARLQLGLCGVGNADPVLGIVDDHDLVVLLQAELREHVQLGVCTGTTRKK